MAPKSPKDTGSENTEEVNTAGKLLLPRSKFYPV